MGKGIIGTIRGEMIGGPLDGAKYGDLPDIGEPFTDCVLSCPLGQHPMAIYICRGEAPVAGFWQFFYKRMEYPSGLDAAQLPVPERVESDAGIPEEVAL